MTNVRRAQRGEGSPFAWLLPLALTAVVIVLAWRLYQLGPKDVRDPNAKERPVVARGDLAADEKATIELFKAASPAVVQIVNFQVQRNRWTRESGLAAAGAGSGFVWDPNGYVVTNYHVVQQGRAFTVTFPNHDVFDAAPVGDGDPFHDVAVLKIDTRGKPLPALPIGTSSDLQVGQKVFAIGNPFGLDQTLTTGVISGLNREIESPPPLSTPIRGVIQMDAAINPGNSGGPLLDSAGRVIGMNAQIASPSGASAGIGFAVPVDIINRVVPQIIRNGRPRRPGLGIAQMGEFADPGTGRRGVVFTAFAPTSPAREAGLRLTTLAPDQMQVESLGDLIVAVDGRPVAGYAQIIGILDAHEVGDEVEVTYLRGGKQETAKVKLMAIE